MIQKPTIHLNGTSPEALLDAYKVATGALRRAIECLHDAAPNARDYYPQGDDATRAATREHVSRAERLRSVLEELFELYEHVSDQADARKR